MVKKAPNDKDGKDTADKGTIRIGESKINPTRTEIEIKGQEGPNKTKTIHAIYKIENHKLTVCYALKAKEPPKDFRASDERLLVTYEQDKQ